MHHGVIRVRCALYAILEYDELDIFSPFRCLASIMNIYRNDKSVEIVVKTHEAANLSNTRDSGDGGGGSNAGRIMSGGAIIASLLFSLLVPTLVA